MTISILSCKGIHKDIKYKHISSESIESKKLKSTENNDARYSSREIYLDVLKELATNKTVDLFPEKNPKLWNDIRAKNISAGLMGFTNIETFDKIFIETLFDDFMLVLHTLIITSTIEALF